MLKHADKRIVVKVDTDSKNNYMFDNGIILRLFPKTSQFDGRFFQPTNGIVISADDIPENAEVLLEHNATHETNCIVEMKDENPNIKYYSVPEMQCYVWRKMEYIDYVRHGYKCGGGMMGAWQPTRYYEIGERVYKPYKGVMQNVKPELIKNTLLIKTGKYKNKIVHTLKDSGYIIIYQDTNGKPNQILTVFNIKDDNELSFHIPSSYNNIEPEELNRIRNYAKQEIIAIDHTLTEQYLNGELYTGLDDEHCKPIEKELEYAK
jgi:hypothetical protein